MKRQRQTSQEEPGVHFNTAKKFNGIVQNSLNDSAMTDYTLDSAAGIHPPASSCEEEIKEKLTVQ